MLNYSVFYKSKMQSVPYSYAVIENLLSALLSKNLAETFPQQQLQESSGEDYGYLWGKMIASEEDMIKLGQLEERWRQRINDGVVTANLENFSSVWQKLIQELWKPDYRQALEHLSGVSLKNCPMLIGFRMYQVGHRHRPHTDEASKVLTHLFFLNQTWLDNWGGRLQILTSEKPESMFEDILPVSNNSVVIVRSDNSWHMVTSVASAATESRLLLRVMFFAG